MIKGQSNLILGVKQTTVFEDESKRKISVNNEKARQLRPKWKKVRGKVLERIKAIDRQLDQMIFKDLLNPQMPLFNQ